MKKLMIIIIALILTPINVYGLSTTASSAILMDMDSGRILYEKDIHNFLNVFLQYHHAYGSGSRYFQGRIKDRT